MTIQSDAVTLRNRIAFALQRLLAVNRSVSFGYGILGSEVSSTWASYRGCPSPSHPAFSRSIFVNSSKDDFEITRSNCER